MTREMTPMTHDFPPRPCGYLLSRAIAQNDRCWRSGLEPVNLGIRPKHALTVEWTSGVPFLLREERSNFS